MRITDVKRKTRQMTSELKQIVNSYRKESYSISNAGQIKNKHSMADIDQLMVDDLVADESNDAGDIDKFIQKKEEEMVQQPYVSENHS